jgi:hypothetical protein
MLRAENGWLYTVKSALCDTPFRDAEIFAVLVVATAWLVTVKLAVVEPAVTTTVAGTVAAAVLSLDRLTVRWAAVPTAGTFSVTVPIELAIPPRTLVGFKFTETATTGFTESVALADPFKVAVIIGLAAELTTLEVTVNVAVVAPVATITLAGTVAAVVMLLDRVTVLCAFVPAAGALRVTVPIEFADPPTTAVGFRLTDTTPASGVTVKAGLWLLPFR